MTVWRTNVTSTHGVEFDRDDQGFWLPYCMCGWKGPPCPDAGVAADFYADHRISALVADGWQIVKTRPGGPVCEDMGRQLMNTKIEQPPMSLAEQKKVYDGELVVNEALALSYEERGGMASERAVILRLLEAGWRPPC